MSRIEDVIQNTVFFIYESVNDAIEGIEGASGFFFGVPSDHRENTGFTYAVTNIHVINQFRSGQAVIKINTLDGGTDTILTDIKLDWKIHPEGDDIAICSVPLDVENHLASFFLHEHIVTDEFIAEHNVGIGDDVTMIGRFKGYEGKNRVIPTARFGSIAQMPIEPIKNHFTGLEQESYLVEMRSISGYSGSPVVLRLVPFRDNPQSRTLDSHSYQRLLGIDWGHLQSTIPVITSSGELHPEKHAVALNSVMAGVVPATKLLDLIDSDEEKQRRAEEDN